MASSGEEGLRAGQRREPIALPLLWLSHSGARSLSSPFLSDPPMMLLSAAQSSLRRSQREGRFRAVLVFLGNEAALVQETSKVVTTTAETRKMTQDNMAWGFDKKDETKLRCWLRPKNHYC